MCMCIMLMATELNWSKRLQQAASVGSGLDGLSAFVEPLTYASGVLRSIQRTVSVHICAFLRKLVQQYSLGTPQVTHE